MRRWQTLRKDSKGASAVEAALALPVAILAIIGVAQMGILYFAHAGLRHLVADGARFASISPRPTETAIRTRLQSGGFGLAPSRIGTPAITYGAQGSANYADIQVTYTVPLDFVFWRPPPIQLTENRRVYIYPAS